jgi:hypothetical protein
MKRIRTSLLAFSACVALTAHAGKVDVVEYAGQALEPGQGLVVMRLEWQRESKGGAAKVTTRDDDKLYVVLKEASGKTKDRYIVPSPQTIKAFVLPAGRWYVNEIYTPGNRGLPQITSSSKAMLQSFEVPDNKIGFAGWFTLKLERDSQGEESFAVAIEYLPDAVREATEAFPEVFQQKELMYCPVGRACKPPSQFKF